MVQYNFMETTPNKVEDGYVSVEFEPTLLDQELAQLSLKSPDRTVRAMGRLVNKIGVEAARSALNRIDSIQGIVEIENNLPLVGKIEHLSAQEAAERIAIISTTLLDILDNNDGTMEYSRLVEKVVRCHLVAIDQVSYAVVALENEGRIKIDVGSVNIVSMIY